MLRGDVGGLHMESAELSKFFEAGLSYERYVATGTPEQQRRWQQVFASAALTPAQTSLVCGFVREMKVLVVSGIWCGDCVQQCPLLERIALANPAKVAVRFVDRDEQKALSSRLRLNAGDRVPVALFLSEDMELCSTFGDRTLNRYRALAVRHLGPSCPTGIVAPDAGELAATLQDWLNEFERVQLMLRLSGRLRQRHCD
jgi:thiol-disulfide isomerase/thioredoxin